MIDPLTRINRKVAGQLALMICLLWMSSPLPAADPTATPIGLPGSIVTDSLGNLYFGSQTRVFKLDRTGVLTVLAGTGVAGYGGDGGPATQALLNFPLVYPELVRDSVDFYFLVGGLTVDGAGNLYIADAYNNRVRKVDRNGIITTVAGTGEQGHSGDGGLALAAQFWWPEGVAFDASGNLLIADSNGTLRKESPDGTVSSVGGSGCTTRSGPGLCVPAQITVDPSGNVYVANTGACVISRVSRDGVITVVAGSANSCGSVSSVNYGDGGPATAATLAFPYAVALDGSVLYIATPDSHCVRKVDASGIISTLAGLCGSAGFGGDGGAAASARLNQPYGVAVDTAGNVYIADTGNYRIRKVSPDGRITTVAGNGVAAFSGQLTDSSVTIVSTTTKTDGSISLFTVVVAPRPTGTVTVLEGSTVLGTAALTTNSLLGLVYAQVQTTVLTGAHKLTVRYSGDSNTLASQSAEVSVNIAANAGSTAIVPSVTAGSATGGSGGGGSLGSLDVWLLLCLAVEALGRRGTRRSTPTGNDFTSAAAVVRSPQAKPE